MTPLKASLQLGKTIKGAARLRTIVGVLARHGFHNVAEKIKLGRFILAKISAEDLDRYTAAERLRMAFEQLGPTFVKLGQLLATRPDLVPKEFVEEFKKLHDQVQPIAFDQIETVLKSHFGPNYRDLFLELAEKPLASASIAQVHRGRLRDGSAVVIKVQRPGIVKIITDDLNVLYTLADLLDKYVPEVRFYNPKAIVDEFFKTLELETNFIVEANNLRRFGINFKDDPNIKIPHVYLDLSGKTVLVMEALEGVPLSQIASASKLGQQSPLGFDPEKIVRTGLRCYMKMVFKDGFFHGDLHAGNIFILPENQIGLIDFGVVGRLSRKTKDAIVHMMIALFFEDYDRLAYEFVDLAPFSGYVDVDRFAKELRDLMAPYHGLSTKNVNLGRLLLDAAAIAAKQSLSVSTDLMLFFKSILTIEGMAHMIVEDFDLLTYVMESSSEVLQTQYDPQQVTKEIGEVAKDSISLLKGFPRQIKQLVRRLNSPNFSVKIKVHHLEDVKRSVEKSANILFLGLIIGSLILSSSLILVQHPSQTQMPAMSLLGYGMAAGLGIVAFINYIRK